MTDRNVAPTVTLTAEDEQLVWDLVRVSMHTTPQTAVWEHFRDMAIQVAKIRACLALPEGMSIAASTPTLGGAAGPILVTRAPDSGRLQVSGIRP